MLPLSPIERVFFFFATLLAVRLLATRLPVMIGSYAMGAVMVAVFYCGPRLYGRDWFWVGISLAACIGGFGLMAYPRMIETEKKHYKSQGPWISRLVIMFLLIAIVVALARGR